MGIFSLLYETESEEAGLKKEWAQRHKEQLEELDDFYFVKAPRVSIKLPKISALFLLKPAYKLGPNTSGRSLPKGIKKEVLL